MELASSFFRGLSPLSPGVKIFILLNSLYISYGTSKENLSIYQDILADHFLYSHHLIV